MKKSPSSSSFSSLSSSSTSSQSSIGSNSNTDQLLEKPKITTKTKRITTKKNVTTTSPVKRSSIFRGVTRHRWTGRFEAHLWDKHTWNLNQKKKGRQVYLGAYDCEEAAARTYDLAALKYWGPDTILNFSIDAYEKELEEMEKMTREEYLASLRRKSSGFSRGVSKYRGVARHHHNGRWEARIGRVKGNKYMYLGTYSTQEEAAAAYDMAAIQYRGANAVTNFNISSYGDFIKEEPLSIDQQLNNLTNIKQEVEQQEQEQEQQQQQQRQEQEQEHQRKEEPEAHLPFYEDSSSTMTNSIFNEHDFVDWGMCVDIGFDPYTVPDIDIPFATTQPGELPDLVYDIGFEDNIGDFIFGTGLGENEVNLDRNENQSFGSYGGLEGDLLKRQPSSSSFSTTTSMDFV